MEGWGEGDTDTERKEEGRRTKSRLAAPSPSPTPTQATDTSAGELRGEWRRGTCPVNSDLERVVSEYSNAASSHIYIHYNGLCVHDAASWRWMTVTALDRSLVHRTSVP